MADPEFTTEEEVNRYYDERLEKINQRHFQRQAEIEVEYKKTVEEINDRYDKKNTDLKEQYEKNTAESKYTKKIQTIDDSINENKKKITKLQESSGAKTELLDKRIRENNARIEFLESRLGEERSSEIARVEQELNTLKAEMGSDVFAVDMNKAQREQDLEDELQELKSNPNAVSRRSRDIENELASREETGRQLIEERNNAYNKAFWKVDELNDKQIRLAEDRELIREEQESYEQEIYQKYKADEEFNETTRQTLLSNAKDSYDIAMLREDDDYELDVSENERFRQEELERLRKLIPNETRDVEFYTFGVYSDGTKRMGIVKVNAVINLPKDYAVTAIPNDVMLEIAKMAWQYIYDIGENPVPTENIEWEFAKPSSKGSATYFFADSYTNDDAITPELDGYSYLPAENAWKRLG